MPFEVAEQNLLAQQFNYGTTAHRQLLERKLAAFIDHYAEMKSRSRPIFLAAAGTAATRILGLYSALLMPIDLALFGFGLWKVQQTMNHHQQYQEAFTDILAIYDWCIPAGGPLPPTNNASIQTLIETLGTLINGERLGRLAPLANGPQQGASWSNYAISGGRALLGLVGLSTGPAPNENILDQRTFTLLVRNLVNGRDTSATDYYCYGEGGRTVVSGLQYGVNAVNSVTGLITSVIPPFGNGQNNGDREDHHPHTL